jgi:hypothetical protein
MDVLLAWGLVIGAGLGALAGIFVLTRAIANPVLRSLLRCLAAVWLLLPWSIEVMPGHYAPAFIVALFEGIFREEGTARPPLVALGLATVVVLVIFLIQALLLRLRRR